MTIDRAALAESFRRGGPLSARPLEAIRLGVLALDDARSIADRAAPADSLPTHRPALLIGVVVGVRVDGQPSLFDPPEGVAMDRVTYDIQFIAGIVPGDATQYAVAEDVAPLRALQVDALRITPAPLGAVCIGCNHETGPAEAPQRTLRAVVFGETGRAAVCPPEEP